MGPSGSAPAPIKIVDMAQYKLKQGLYELRSFIQDLLREDVIISTVSPFYSSIWPVLNRERMNDTLKWITTTLVPWSHLLKWDLTKLK